MKCFCRIYVNKNLTKRTYVRIIGLKPSNKQQGECKRLQNKGLEDRSAASDGERVVVMKYIKSERTRRKGTAEKKSENEIKMYNQVKRIVGLQGRSFNILVERLKQNKGEKIEEVLHQLYRERKI